MKPRKPDESDAHYIKRLEDANKELRAHNKRLTEWGDRINEAITVLACEGSLAFQAMAERAGVRSHQSVTEVVRLFDYISHPQWRSREEKPEKIKFPEDWELDAPGTWSGDADMQLNAPIAEAIEILEHLKFSGQHFDAIRRITDLLHKAVHSRVDGIKEAAGFKPKHLSPPMKHIKDMPHDELVALCDALGWMALDLAQDMDFAGMMLRRDLRAASYRRIHADLYRLSQFAVEPQHDGGINIKVFGAEVPM